MLAEWPPNSEPLAEVHRRARPQKYHATNLDCSRETKQLLVELSRLQDRDITEDAGDIATTELFELNNGKMAAWKKEEEAAEEERGKRHETKERGGKERDKQYSGVAVEKGCTSSIRTYDASYGIQDDDQWSRRMWKPRGDLSVALAAMSAQAKQFLPRRVFHRKQYQPGRVFVEQHLAPTAPPLVYQPLQLNFAEAIATFDANNSADNLIDDEPDYPAKKLPKSVVGGIPTASERPPIPPASSLSKPVHNQPAFWQPELSPGPPHYGVPLIPPPDRKMLFTAPDYRSNRAMVSSPLGLSGRTDVPERSVRPYLVPATPMGDLWLTADHHMPSPEPEPAIVAGVEEGSEMDEDEVFGAKKKKKHACQLCGVAPSGAYVSKARGISRGRVAAYVCTKCCHWSPVPSDEPVERQRRKVWEHSQLSAGEQRHYFAPSQRLQVLAAQRRMLTKSGSAVRPGLAGWAQGFQEHQEEAHRRSHDAWAVPDALQQRAQADSERGRGVRRCESRRVDAPCRMRAHVHHRGRPSANPPRPAERQSRKTCAAQKSHWVDRRFT
jgi:hypothetical protein